MAPDLDHLMMSASGAAFELQDLIRKLNIPVHLNCKLEEVRDDSIICSNIQTFEKTVFQADTVLLALGMVSRHDVADSLRHSAPETEICIVGDAVKPGLVGPAVMSAFRAAAYI
jgi:thioredoxin reductase